MALERPQYELIKIVNGVEIRNYEPYQVASCDVSEVADLNDASNRGFRYLFNYISGQNVASQKISMTVPVQQTPTDNGWKISFVVPKEFSQKGAPTPIAKSVAIEEIGGGLVAALKYRGTWSSQRFETKKQELLELLKNTTYKPTGQVSSAVFNPPLTPPFLRHNEVLVQVKAAN